MFCSEKGLGYETIGNPIKFVTGFKLIIYRSVNGKTSQMAPGTEMFFSITRL